MIRVAAALALALFVSATAFAADLPTPPSAAAPPVDDATAHARDLFSKGAALSRRTQWAEALDAFEEVGRIKSHPVVTFNIAVCERALGRYTRARRTFASFLRSIEGPIPPSDVPASIIEDARNYARELDGLLVHLQVTLRPRDARLAIDGRPLAGESPGVFVAGVAAPGVGESPGEEQFELLLDPGVHLFRASRPGHADAVVNRSFAPATRAPLVLELETLPGQVHIEASEPRAVVLIDGRDVGIAPVDVERPAGTYRVEVQKSDYVAYATSIVLDAGEHASLTARLTPETHPVTFRWWFWAGAAAVVAGGVAITYAATRPSPQPPPYQGGSSGWIVTLP